jgi:apolipoprotein N-acyltransferase
VLVNLSNDGWFVHPAGLRGYWQMLTGSVPPNSEYVQTTEQSQHWVQSVFRAIENRVPVVRSANTGISGGIDSTGRRIAQVAEGESMWSSAVAGTAVISVRTDTRITLYSRLGDAFGWSVVIAWIFWTGRLWWSRRCERKQSLG